MKERGRVLGLDIGQRRIGTALSDPSGLLASPAEVLELRGRENGQDRVAALVEEHQVACVVVGLPLLMDGTEGEEARRVREWSEGLAQRLPVPVELWDERLSTVAAERALVESGMRRERRKQRRDAVAAALILQSYLDAQAGRQNEGGDSYQTRQSSPLR